MADDIVDLIREFFKTTGLYLAQKAIDPTNAAGIISGEHLKRLVEPQFMPEGSIDANAFDNAPYEEACDDLGELLYKQYLDKRKTWSIKEADNIERTVSLRVIDRNWQGHIDTMSHLRDGISLRSYAQRNPLQDYVNEGYDLFKEMNDKAAVDTCFNLLNVRLQRQMRVEQEHRPDPNAVDTNANVKAGRVEQKTQETPAETASNEDHKE